MPKNRIIITLGVLIALLPLLGFPHAWEAFFQVFAGLAIITTMVWSTIDRKLSLKAKAHMRHARKIVSEPEAAPTELIPQFGKRVTDFYPKTAPPGRRTSDLNPTLLDKESPVSDETAE